MPVSLSAAATRPQVVCDGAMWTANVAAIGEACKHLGVRGRVRVIASPFRRGRWAGMHTELANGMHEVRVGLHLTPESASRTLWHELSHAAQSDRGVAGGTTHLRGDAYHRDPREVEARAAEHNHRWLALTS